MSEKISFGTKSVQHIDSRPLRVTATQKIELVVDGNVLSEVIVPQGKTCNALVVVNGAFD
jgi:hypothetical protein